MSHRFPRRKTKYLPLKLEAILRHFTEKGKELGEAVETVHGSAPARRNKPVVCPLTGQLTTGIYGLSDEALREINRLINRDKELKKLEQSTKVVNYAASYGYFRVPNPRGVSVWSVEIIEALRGVVPDVQILRKHKLPDNVKWLSSDDENDTGGGDTVVMVTFREDQEEAVLNLVETVRRVVRETQENSFRAGRSFLVGLATGDTNIQEYNDLHLREG